LFAFRRKNKTKFNDASVASTWVQDALSEILDAAHAQSVEGITGSRDDGISDLGNAYNFLTHCTMRTMAETLKLLFVLSKWATRVFIVHTYINIICISIP